MADGYRIWSDRISTTGYCIHSKIGEEINIIKIERDKDICPTCGQRIKAVAKDGPGKGYCTVAR
jgi:uncharacterized protein (UPF0212 family)